MDQLNAISQFLTLATYIVAGMVGLWLFLQLTGDK